MAKEGKIEHKSMITASLITFCCIYRIINALFIQTQFDPDEYWQNNEVAYCLVFSSKYDTIDNDSDKYYNCAQTWEWKRTDEKYYNGPSSTNTINIYSKYFKSGPFHEYAAKPIMQGPVRSYINVLPTILLYHASKKYSFDTNFVIQKGPILLNALLVVVPIDLLVLHISGTIFHNDIITRWCFVCSLLNWFHGYGLIRTYSNSFECLLFMISLALLSQVRSLRIFMYVFDSLNEIIIRSCLYLLFIKRKFSTIKQKAIIQK